jgi:hypothetical protein
MSSVYIICERYVQVVLISISSIILFVLRYTVSRHSINCVVSCSYIIFISFFFFNFV